MKNLKAKLRKNGGFTLIEMLIVVAIIAILIAISIPLVGNALERAREATDAANERAAKAEITIMYLNHAADSSDTEYVANQIYAYDAVDGKLVGGAGATAPTAYGQCTDATTGHKGKYIIVQYDETNHKVIMQWTNSATIPTSITAETTLCSAKLSKTT